MTDVIVNDRGAKLISGEFIYLIWTYLCGHFWQRVMYEYCFDIATDFCMHKQVWTNKWYISLLLRILSIEI